MFAEHIKKVVDNVGGCVGGVIMGLDGIAVDSYVRKDDFDVTTIGMEFSFILTQVKKAAEILQVGALKEISIRAERLTLVIRMINEEYFLAVALTPEGNFGKCRFLLRIATPRIIADL